MADTSSIREMGHALSRRDSTHRSLGLLLVWIVAALMVFAGCGGDGDGAQAPDAAGADACVGRGCPAPPRDATGGDGDPSEDANTGGAACDDENPCAEGSVCDADLGRCVPSCRDDDDCGATSRCGASRRCEPRQACTTTADCGGDVCDTCLGVCVASRGSTACVSRANCGFDEYCDACVGLCVASATLCDPCSSDESCGEVEDQCLDYQSGGSFCGRACGSCPVGYTCHPDLQQCVAISGDCVQVRQCESALDCPAGQTCTPARVCAPGCDGDEACPGDNVCVVGDCVPPCENDAACTAPATCVDRRCRVPGGCLSSRDCEEAETYCDRNTFRCVPGCEVDNDCGTAASECSGGTCIVAGCRGNFSCAFGQVCDLDAGACVEPDGPYCDPCDGGDIDSCGARSICGTFSDDDGNEEGAFCLVECSADPDNRCPQGYGCQDVDVDGDQRSVCYRICSRDPV